MNSNFFKSSNKEELRCLLKGLRYNLGLSLLDVEKAGFSRGLFGNWECGLCKPNRENIAKLNSLIEKAKKSKEELIEIGKSNVASLIEEIAKDSQVPIDVFIRFVISRCTTINSLKGMEKMRKGEIGLSAKMKEITVDGKFKNLVGIRSLPQRGSVLEDKAHRELIKRGFLVIKNAVISDSEVGFKKEVDLYAIKNKKELIVECSMARIDIKLQDLIALFSYYKKLGIEKTIYMNTKLTQKGREILNNHGIFAIKPEELGRCLDGLNHRT